MQPRPRRRETRNQALAATPPGLPESRAPADAVRTRAANLNNQAISLITLGKPAGAEQLLERVLRIVPLHPQATFNRELLHWRTGRITDLGLLRELEELRQANPADWHPEHYLSLVHAERGDIESSLRCAKAAMQNGGQAEAQSTLQKLEASASHGGSLCTRSGRPYPGDHGRAAERGLAPGGFGQLGRHAANLGSDERREAIRTIPTQTQGCECLAVTPDLRWALTGAMPVVLWDLESGQRVRAFEGHTQPVVSLDFSADGSLALSGSRDKTLRIWEVATGRCLQTLEGHTASIACACLSVDGRLVISAAGPGEMWMWEVASGQRIRAFETQETAAECLSLSKDGRWVLTGDVDSKLHLWSTKNGMRVRTLRGHTEKVTSVALTADGRWALSGGLDETLRLWDVTTGCCVRTIEGQLANVYSVAVSADGRLGISGGGQPDRSQRQRDAAVGLRGLSSQQRPVHGAGRAMRRRRQGRVQARPDPVQRHVDPGPEPGRRPALRRGPLPDRAGEEDSQFRHPSPGP